VTTRSVETVRSADGTTVAVEREGDGPALVVVAGAFCDRTAFAGMAGMLAGGRTVFRYDRRGRGGSGNTLPYSVDREIEDLDAVVAAAGGSAALCGHSSGAALALEFAARSAAVTALVAYEPPYAADDTSAEDDRFRRELTEAVDTGRLGDAARLFLVQTGMPAEAVAGMAAAPWWPRMEALAPTLPYEVAVVGGGVPVARLATITAPTLVLAGGNSSTWFRDTARAVAAAVPGARDGELPDQDHNVDEKVLAAAVSDFVGGRIGG
jgi:pimeloyl-ACP methyl ester carboxylesterase